MTLNGHSSRPAETDPYVAVSVSVDADYYVDVGVDGNVVLSVQSFRFIILKVR